VIEEGMAKFVRDSGKGCDCRIRVQGPSAGYFYCHLSSL
jgi:hypothetical protein